MTIEDDRIERAAQLAWETFAAEHEHADELWRHQRPERQARWRKIAFAMLVFMQPSEQVRRLESQLTGLRRAYDQACEQRDKYMRRTAEWRDAALNDRFRQDSEWLVEEVSREHIRRCEIEQCDTCSGVLGIEERVRLLDGTTRACTGCSGCEACSV